MPSNQVISTQSFSDKLVTFRYPQITDAPQVAEYSNELNITSPFMLFPDEWISAEATVDYLQRIQTKQQKGESVYIFACCEEELIGRVNINLQEGVQRHLGELGISVRQDWRNLGLGTALINLVIKLAREKLPSLELIQLTVFANNDQAIHLYQKLGFKEFGRLPRGIKRGEQYWDFVYMWREVGQGD
jgi:RimJ/RimL family protein N-acetyltransferase